MYTHLLLSNPKKSKYKVNRKQEVTQIRVQTDRL